MDNMGAFSIFVTLLLVSVVYSVDKTREEGASGSAVVEAVVDLLRERCIISNDNFFLRRMAYAASKDGEKSDTYRQGFHGGIWQINKQNFLLTKTSYNLRNQRIGIQENFSIDWSRVTWSYLRQPVYSGIAAALYVQSVLERNRTTIPSTVDDQALFWTKYFGGHENDFLAVNNLRQVSCDVKPVDLVFVVDESTSIGDTDFDKMKTFLENLVDQITISKTAFRVGLVKFHTSATTVFDLNRYSQKSYIQRAIHSMGYAGGGTHIGEGIKSGRSVFSRSSRKDATKVMILLTDGKSKNKTLTAQEANRTKSEGVSIFVIGIGKVDREEITSAASEPTCVHVFMLQGFSGIDNILYDVRRQSCKAPKKVKVIGNETKVEVDLKPNQDVEGTVEIYTVAQVTVITANVTCGEVELFASAETSTPSEVFYDVKGEARDNDPASFSIKNRGRTVFVHYIGKLVTTMEYCKTRTNTFSMFSITFSQAIDECERSPCKNDGTCVDLPRGFTCQCASGYTGRSCEDEVNMCESSPCQNHGTCSKNGNGYRCYCAFGFSGRHCEVNIDDCAPNPCRNGGSCSDLVNNFHCSCPNGYTGKACNVIVNHCRSSSCQNGGSCISSPSGFSCYCQTGYTGSNCETGIVQPSNSISMCIPKGNIYHIPYPKDKTKFIQCDEFGGSFVMPCAPGTQFNKDYQTCVSRKTAECPRAGYQTFADPLNPGRFYQCSNGVPYLKSCPGGLVFDDNYKICTWSTRKRQETENSDLIDDDDKRNNDNNSFDDDDDDDAMESERELEESKLDNTYEKKRRGNLEKLKEANVTCGEVELFASAETSTPSEVFYDVKGEARDNDPASFSIKNRGRTVFVHYIGKLVTTMEYCKTRTNTFSMFSITFSQAIDECERSPCKNDGTCVDLPRGFTCQCASGYTGRSCEDEVNMCESSPCQNHGTCSKNGNGYRCYCAFGFSGRHCEVNIDDCAPNPCRNGGSCSDLVNNFHCSCPNGYTGKACNVIVNHCRSSSCQNGGSCISSPSGFSCYCQTGYTGSNCETGIVQPSNSISMCIPKGNIYHIPYPKDKTKFIQCDEFGGSFVMPCAPGTQFNKDYQTCVSRKTAECPRAGYQTFADPLNPGRFYQCSNGVPYLKSCPGGLVFDDNYKICTWSTRKRQETENSDLIDDDDKRNNDNNSFDDDDDDDAMESERELEESKLDNTYEKKRRGNLEKLKEVVRNFLD